MLTTTQLTTNAYSKDYKEYCFLTWWRVGRPNWTNLVLQIEKFQDRMLPSTATLSDWAKEGDWVERANKLDLEVMDEIKQRFITEKAQMLARHAEVGKTLQDYGLEYLQNNPITSQGVALRAIQMGVEIEGSAAQIEKLVSSIAKMDDPQIEEGLKSLLDKAKLRKVKDDDRSEQQD